MPEPLLDVRDVHTYYGDSWVVQGASLSVPEGRVTAVLGRNGMGKTTLIRTIMNLTPPARGEVRFRGEPLTGLPPYRVAQKRIALVPQGRRIFRSLTVRENLQLPVSSLAVLPRRDGAPRWDLARVYETFPRLRERASQLAGSLSGGEQSMLAIGRALMADPDLLVMDEPSEGLAPVIVRQIREMLVALKASGLTILLVEQNAALALAVADDVAILASGKVVWRGTPDALEAQGEIKHRHLGV